MNNIKTLELYEVVIEYKDLQAYEQWEKDVQRYSAAGDRDAFCYVLPVVPPPKQHVGFAAVVAWYGGDHIRKAAEAVLQSVIGEPDCWEKFQANVVSVKRAGIVAIDNSSPGE